MKRGRALHGLAVMLALGTAAASAAEPVPPPPAASGSLLIESAPAPPWSPRAESALQLLQRAARGSGIVVQREGHRIRVSAWDDAAFLPNGSEPAPPLRALLDEWTDSGGPISTWRVAVAGRTAPGGSAQANEQLAQARAQAIQRLLKLRGFGAVSGGEAFDASPGAQRRGVELLLESAD
jgi:outer membrane protein OmpA-like peptidoglycan-associated protein